MGVDVFEDPYITAKMIFTHCSQFHNCIPYTDKKSFTFSWDFLFSKSRYYPLFCRNFRMSDILAEPPFDWFINLLRPSTFSYQEENSIITAIQSITIQTYLIDENALRNNQYLLRYSLPHYGPLYCAAFILQSLHPVSTFRIEKVCGSLKTLPVIQKMLVSPQILALVL